MLREKTQRRLCRVLFIVGCLLPTLLVSGWAFARFHPAYRATLLAALSERVGYTVHCERITTPRPGLYVATQIRVSHPLDDHLLGQCDRLTLQRREGVWHAKLGDLQIERQTSWKRSGDHSALPFHLAATIQSLAITDGPDTLAQWDRLRLDATHETMALLTHTADGKADAELRMTRSEEAGTRRSTVAFNTGSSSLPLGILPLEGAFASFAEVSRFQGLGEFEQVDGKPRGSAQGRLEVGTLPSEATAGLARWDSARVTLRELKWHGPIVTRLHADIDAHRGNLTRSLVWGLNDRLGCPSSGALNTLWEDDSAPGIPFDQLACEVEFDAAGLVLVGACGSVEPDAPSGSLGQALLNYEDEPLLFEPRQRPVPLYKVLQAFWPNSPARLPATAEARSLAQRLPLPNESLE